MLNSEMIVGLWFVPVVLSILIPLAMFCIWSGHQLIVKTTGKIGLVDNSAEEVQDESYARAWRPRHAI